MTSRNDPLTNRNGTRVTTARLVLLSWANRTSGARPVRPNGCRFAETPGSGDQDHGRRDDLGTFVATPDVAMPADVFWKDVVRRQAATTGPVAYDAGPVAVSWLKSAARVTRSGWVTARAPVDPVRAVPSIPCGSPRPVRRISRVRATGPER